MTDLFHEYCERFLQGDFFGAISLILPHPDTDYDTLTSEEPLFRHLVNYVDACLFDRLPAAYDASLCLYSLLSDDTELASRYSDLLGVLAFEQNIIGLGKEEVPQFLIDPSLSSTIKQVLISERLETYLLPDQVQQVLKDVPTCLQSCFQRKLDLLKGWVLFKASKRLFAKELFKNNFYWAHPWYPLQYTLTPQIPVISSSDIPLVFLEPLQSDLSPLLDPLRTRPALFVFETKEAFLQMLQFPKVIEALVLPFHLIYILELYPHEQFLLQSREFLKNRPFQPIMLIERNDIDQALPAFTQALSAYCAQPDEALRRDNEIGNWLYQVSKNLIQTIEMKRLGVSRAAAFETRLGNRRGDELHKGLPAEDRPLGVTPPDFIGKKLDDLAKEQITPRRSLSKKPKLKLAHITPHLIDGTGHAHSRLIENLIVHHDRDSFDLVLILHELTQFHAYEYPFNYYASPPSVVTAPHRLQLFEQQGTAIHILEKPTYYEEDARWVATLLKQLDIDIAVFHCFDVVNMLAAQLTDVPKRVYFEHGVPPSYPLYDLAILSSPPDLYRDHLAKIGVEGVFLPFAMDVMADWTEEERNVTKSSLKESLGFPPDSVIMTTISNHLDTRLSDEMCEAIVEILQKVPNAYYAPIGYVKDTSKFTSFFGLHGVGDRVLFLGHQDRPSLLARCMDIYLNEFPVGSGVAILDAMACGCPVVSMYDTRGAIRKTYGGIFAFGVERCIDSCKKEDYVALACRLLTDKPFYQEWSHYTLEQYQKQSNPAAYTQQFERFILPQRKTKNTKRA